MEPRRWRCGRGSERPASGSRFASAGPWVPNCGMPAQWGAPVGRDSEVENRGTWLTTTAQAETATPAAYGVLSSSSRLPKPAKSPATWGRTTSWSPPGATSATCPERRPTCRPNTRRSPGRASVSTSTPTSSRSMSSVPKRRAPSPNSRACSKESTSSISPPTVTARARRSPGICSRP